MVLPKDESPAATGSATPPDLLPLDSAAAKRALDDLFANAHVYRTGSAYKELLDFIARFRFYAPFNAVLIHTQRPGARFVAPAHRWIRDYRRAVKPGARPIVILQTMGPVMFVFDVSDTAGADLPADVADPFAVSAALGDATAASMLERLKDNAKRDGVAVVEVAYGSQRAGQIGPSPRAGTTLRIRRGRQGNEESFEIPERYSLHLNQSAAIPSQLATLVHELAHLYCGHLGSPNESWWPDRRGLDKTVREFEAESVAYMVCERIGLKTRSAEYLAGYVRDHANTPDISLHVLKAANLIEQMMAETQPPRRTGKATRRQGAAEAEEDRELFFA